MDAVATLKRPPAWYWIVAAGSLLWNVFGAFVFAVMVLMVTGTFDIASEEAMANLTEAQRAQTVTTKEVILGTPMWSNIAFAFAVGCGVAGSVALLMRRRIATPLFIVSLAGVLVQNAYNYLLSDAVAKIGVGLSPVVILIAIALVPYSMFCGKKAWLR